MTAAFAARSNVLLLNFFLVVRLPRPRIGEKPALLGGVCSAPDIPVVRLQARVPSGRNHVNTPSSRRPHGRERPRVAPAAWTSQNRSRTTVGPQSHPPAVRDNPRSRPSCDRVPEGAPASRRNCSAVPGPMAVPGACLTFFTRTSCIGLLSIKFPALSTFEDRRHQRLECVPWSSVPASIA